MAQEEKSFRIKQKISYEEQLNKEKKRMDNDLFLTGFVALAGVLSFASINHQSNTEFEQLLFKIITITNGGMTIYGIKELIKSICKKTLLQDKIEDINSELNLEENEQKSKGMK